MMIVVLTVLSSVSGFVLAGLKNYTKDRIENNELNLVKGPTVRQILEGCSNDPVADRFKVMDGKVERTIFVGVFDGQANTVVFEATGKGYGDKFGLMVAVDMEENTIIGVGVTTHKETPGLGGNAKDDPSFAAQFKGLPIDQPVGVTQDNGSINALSGATITSRAVCDATNDATQKYQQLKPQLADKLKGFSK